MCDCCEAWRRYSLSITPETRVTDEWDDSRLTCCGAWFCRPRRYTLWATFIHRGRREIARFAYRGFSSSRLCRHEQSVTARISVPLWSTPPRFSTTLEERRDRGISVLSKAPFAPNLHILLSGNSEAEILFTQKNRTEILEFVFAVVARRKFQRQDTVQQRYRVIYS